MLSAQSGKVIRRLTRSMHSTNLAKSLHRRFRTTFRYSSPRWNWLRCLRDCGEVLSRPRSCCRGRGPGDNMRMSGRDKGESQGQVNLVAGNAV